MEEAANGPRYYKEKENGVFVKLNEERVKNKNMNLMEQVQGVRESPNNRGRDKNHVMVSFFCNQQIMLLFKKAIRACHNINGFVTLPMTRYLSVSR